MYGIGSRSNQYTELVTPIEGLLFDGEDDWTQVLVAGKVVPVFGAIEVLLVCLLFHGDQFKGALLVPLLLNGCLFTGTTKKNK